VDLKKICSNKIFWSAITASFAFTMIMFNVTMNATSVNAESIQIISEENTRAVQIVSDANTKAIQIVNEDIKQILKDTSYIRGIIEYDNNN